jgi:hypothetical protein
VKLRPKPFCNSVLTKFFYSDIFSNLWEKSVALNDENEGNENEEQEEEAEENDLNRQDMKHNVINDNQNDDKIKTNSNRIVMKSSNTYPIVKDLYRFRSMSLPDIQFKYDSNDSYEKVIENSFKPFNRGFVSNSFPSVRVKKEFIYNSLPNVLLISGAPPMPITPPPTPPPPILEIVSIRRKR